MADALADDDDEDDKSPVVPQGKQDKQDNQGKQDKQDKQGKQVKWAKLRRQSEQSKKGKLGKMNNLYSRFRPQRTQSKPPIARRPGDIPGSRTHDLTSDPNTDTDTTTTTNDSTNTPSSATPTAGPSNLPSSSLVPTAQPLVGETVTLESHELFTQLCAVVHLVKTTPGGVFSSLVGVCDGMLRVWRDWLKEMGPLGGASPYGGSSMYGSSSSVYGSEADPASDRRILWVNKGDKAVGIRCRVYERRWRREGPAPLLVARDEDVAVSYFVELEGRDCMLVLVLSSFPSCPFLLISLLIWR